jgi:PAS domain S-box-containing protein
VIPDDFPLMDELEAGVAVMDGAGTIVRWNSHAERILGLSAADAIGKPWADVLAVVGGENMAGREVREAAVKPGGWHGLTGLRLGRDRTVWVRAHVQALPLEDGEQSPGIAAIFWQQIDGNRARLPYDDLLARSPEALFLTDMRGIVIDANEVAARLLGEARARLIGSRVQDAVDDWTPEDFAVARAELESAGSIVRELVLHRPDGSRLTVEAIGTAVSPIEGGYLLVRVRDLTLSKERERMLRDLGALARLGEDPIEVADVARRAIEIVAATWKPDCALAAVDEEGVLRFVAEPGTPEEVRSAFAALSTTGLAGRLRDSERPFAVNLGDREAAPEWAELGRTLGLGTLWSTPLWFADRRIGAILMMWISAPDFPFNEARLEQTGRFAGLAIGNADLRLSVRRDAAVRASLEGSARIAGVVMAQMTDAIITIDRDRSITAVNPAAERIYGLRAEDVVGRPVAEVVDQFEPDGSPFRIETMRQVIKKGFWHGRAIHRPLVGSRAGQHVVIDLSLNTIRDEKHRPAGMIAISRPVTSASQLDSDAALLSSLAVAIGRARMGHQVAEASLDLLCEASGADVGMVATWTEAGPGVVEASRGLSDDLLNIVVNSTIPALARARDVPGQLISFEEIPRYLAGTEDAGVFEREGMATGFLVDLRVRDEVIGVLGLGSRRRSWNRPTDGVALQMAAQIATALENARLMERLDHGLTEEKRLTTQLEAMMGLTQLPTGKADEQDVAQALLDKAMAALGADGGTVVRLREGRLQVIARHNVPDHMIRILEARPASSLNFWLTLTSRPEHGAIYHELADELHREPGLNVMAQKGVASQAYFPIWEGDNLVAAFLCYFRSSSHRQSLLDDRNVQAVGRIISIAYSNVRMSEGLAEAAEHERRLTAELQALQELTLLGATSDDLASLAAETIEEVVLAAGATGGAYFLPASGGVKVEPVVWVGQPSARWPAMAVGEDVPPPPEWPSLDELRRAGTVWLSTGLTEHAGTAGRQSQAVLPLRVEDELAGLLHLEWTDSPRAEQFDVHFLEPIARICSISLGNFRLRSELVRRAATQRALSHRIDTLDELTRIGEQAGSFEELAHRTVSLVREALGASGVCYLLIEPGHHFETHAISGETGAFQMWLKGVPAKEVPGGSILLAGGGSVLNNFVAGQVNERVLPLARATGYRAFGAIPIRTGAELAGALLCFFDHPAADLPLDESALDSVARIAGIALANYRLRESLASSEERYRTLFEETPDALLVTALDGTILNVNEAAWRMYRMGRGEMLGRYFGLLVSADEREMARRRQIVWAQGRGNFKDRGRRADATEFPVEVEVRVVELDDQRRFLHLMRDLSDQERLQRELLQAQKMEAIGELVSGVAHELNNPLAAIVAFSQLMQTDGRLPEDMRHQADLLRQEADRTRRIVQNLLDFARARPPERRPTSLDALVRSVLELQSYALSTNRVNVAVDIPWDLPNVDLDRAQFQQVLLNLTINAIQAMRARGSGREAHLLISAALVESEEQKSGSERSSERVRITVTDDGPGVPENARAKLFDPFFTTKEPGEGTGLGLSVSFGIVAAHSGHLWYEPGPGGAGSSFVIEMPVVATEASTDEWAIPVPESLSGILASQRGVVANPASAPKARPKETPEPDAALPSVTAPAARTPPPPPPAPEAPTAAASSAAAATPPSAEPGRSAARPRILALDDEPSIRAFLRTALSRENMECWPFQDGAQALDGLRDMAFDVMLIDHRMPGMSGIEFYEAAVEFRPELAERAIFMSGDVLNSELRGFALQRAIRVLSKPFDIEAVIKVVREVLAATRIE